jgi:hypothetical protein
MPEVMGVEYQRHPALAEFFAKLVAVGKLAGEPVPEV